MMKKALDGNPALDRAAMQNSVERPQCLSTPIAQKAVDALRRHVMTPYLRHCIDEEHGGFLVDFDERWRPCGPHDKSLEHAARTTLCFVILDRLLPGEGCDRLARHGFSFLTDAMWDRQHGGFFALVDRTGRPLWEGLKHPHGITYVARAFRLGGAIVPNADLWANRALDWLDTVAWDENDAGYWGCYRRDLARYRDRPLPTRDGKDPLARLPNLKEINTQGDAIATLSAFVSSGAEGRCLERLDTLVRLVTERLIDPSGAMPFTFRRDWHPVAGLVWIGHQFQMARALAQAKCSPDLKRQALARSRELTDFCLSLARHGEGGFRFAVNADGCTWLEEGAPSHRSWWVQLEAVHALHVLSHHDAVDPEARARYLGARDEQWTFVREHLLDTQHGGVHEFPKGAIARPARRRFLRRLPVPSASGQKSHRWKDPFHEVELLTALAFDQSEAVGAHNEIRFSERGTV